MRRHITTVCLLLAVLAAPLSAQRPKVETFLPADTKGFVTIPDVQRVQQSWDKIALGKLAADPVVAPFVDDMQAQIQTRLDRTGVRVGIDVEDLLDVCAGEVAIAFIQPKKGKQKHAVASVADVTGKQDKVDALLKKVDASMKARNATAEVKKVGGVDMNVYTVPVKKGARKTFKAVLFQFDNRLVAVDHEDIATEILANMKGAGTPALADQEAYKKVVERCDKEADGLAPELVFFVEPVGYALVAREAAAVPAGRQDMLSAISKQGFDAVQGMGGYLNLNAGDFEILLRSYTYAPPVPGAGAEKYELAARVLSCAGSAQLDIEPWVPDTINSYASATWNVQDAYRFIDTLVDEIADSPGFWEDFKDSFLHDESGPQISIDDDIVAHLGDRVSLMTDSVEPVGPESERFLIAISLLKPDKMAESVKKILEADAALTEIEGHEIWEIINDDEDAFAGGDDFDAFSSFSDEVGEDEDEDGDQQPLLMTNFAVSVVHGHLMIASHVDFIVEVLRRDNQGPSDVNACADYQAVMNALKTLGSTNNDTGRVFSRSDEELQVSYEMIRQGKMPESKGLVGQLLNRVLGSKEKGVVREQQINAKNMPEFQVVRRYLGPVGMFIAAEDDGMFGAAVGLSKDCPMNPSLEEVPHAAERNDGEEISQTQ